MILITLIFQISDLQRALYVGGHLPNEDPFVNTRFEPDSLEIAFSIQLDSNGLFQSVKVAPGWHRGAPDGRWSGTPSRRVSGHIPCLSSPRDLCGRLSV